MFSFLLLIIYLSFISLGLPDSLLGAAWPSMYEGFGVPLGYAGIISAIISAGTIYSSLQSDKLTRKYGTGKVTAVSVGLTAFALFGFSFSSEFWMLCLWAIPYGLGAGSVDSSINNYVALHYASSHMNWLHCMWGIGAASGPYAMAYAINNYSWPLGYRIIGGLQIVLTAMIFISLPLWVDRSVNENNEENGKPLSIKQVLSLPGAKEVMLSFFCYCAIETTSGLWAASYLVLQKGLSQQQAAGYASLFYIGITVGRAICGFISNKLKDRKMVLLGEYIIVLGVMLILLPFKNVYITLAGLILVGMGCAPIYPALIHLTPIRFGADKSQAVIGVQMASAYIGTCIMPPLLGAISTVFSIKYYPVFIAIILVLMFLANEAAEKRTAER